MEGENDDDNEVCIGDGENGELDEADFFLSLRGVTPPALLELKNVDFGNFSVDVLVFQFALLSSIHEFLLIF